MVETDLPRLRHWLVALLLLVALSLLGHYVADAVHASAVGTCCVQEVGNSRSAGGAHAADLHGRFLPNRPPVPEFHAARLALGDTRAPIEMAWTPPTPVRPPITP